MVFLLLDATAFTSIYSKGDWDHFLAHKFPEGKRWTEMGVELEVKGMMKREDVFEWN